MVHERSVAKRAVPIAAGIVALLALFMTAVALMAQTSAQPNASASQFEVASIKPASPSAPQHGRLTRMESIIGTSPGLLTVRTATLRELIEGAYSLDNYLVIGGPQWIDSVRFEVQAKSAAAANRQQLLLMLRPLLASRFKLVLHRETREMGVYALALAKGGPKFQTAKPWPESKPRPLNHLGYNVDMSWLATYLTHLGSDMPVVDKTGLTGKYDLDLDMDKVMAAAGAESGNSSISSIFQATVDALEEQRGLKLVRSKAPVEVLVIDHAERPTQN
jgi:uncharacterized protein (TIGR03435 family)